VSRSHLSFVPVLLLAFVVAACGGAPEPNPASVTPATSDPTAPPEAVAPVPDVLPDVVARVNGEDVTAGELTQAIARIEAQLGAPLPPEERSHVVREILDQLIAFRLLTQAVAAEGLTMPDAELDAELALVQNQFPSPQAFEEALAAQGTTLDTYRAETRRQILVERLVEQAIADELAVTPEQVTAFYEDNPDQFRVGAQVRARHILIGVPEVGTADARAEARSRAEAVLAELQAGGDFEALAREHSDDPGSAVAGGDLGYFSQGDMVPTFDEAAFALAPGETSGLVESQFGFHIIRVVDRQAARMVPLDDVRPQVEQFLQGQNQQSATQAYIDALRAQGTVEILI
jgi:peptidyl-prolyl cis-trans isomerase C